MNIKQLIIETLNERRPSKYFHDLLAAHIDDPDWKVRQQVAKHKKYAGALVNDSNAFVRQQVAKHKEYAGALVNDSNAYVRAQVAKHKEYAGALVNDSNAYVISLARRTLGIK